MHRLFPLILPLALAACGIDGAPTHPEAKPGVTVSGEARIGVVGTL